MLRELPEDAIGAVVVRMTPLAEGDAEVKFELRASDECPDQVRGILLDVMAALDKLLGSYDVPTDP